MSGPTLVVAGSSHIKPEELHHHALEQLPGLAYCINDNPNWGEFCALSLSLSLPPHTHPMQCVGVLYLGTGFCNPLWRSLPRA